MFAKDAAQLDPVEGFPTAPLTAILWLISDEQQILVLPCLATLTITANKPFKMKAFNKIHCKFS